MLRITALLLLICFHAGLSNGMECSFGNKNFLSKIVNSCPGFLDPPENSYCCFDGDEIYCCNVTEFSATMSWMTIIIIVILVGVVSLIGFCVSCLCCSCCPWYRRRHRGTVYGRVQVPRSVVHVIQPPTNVPQQIPYCTSASNPMCSTGVSQPPPYTPPPYTPPANDIYAKQAPYNPNYV